MCLQSKLDCKKKKKKCGFQYIYLTMYYDFIELTIYFYRSISFGGLKLERQTRIIIDITIMNWSSISTQSLSVRMENLYCWKMELVQAILVLPKQQDQKKQRGERFSSNQFHWRRFWKMGNLDHHLVNTFAVYVFYKMRIYSVLLWGFQLWVDLM